MRYATVFKFIAVILCAATLLGAVGSAAGLVFLTELGGKNINEHYVEQLRSQSIAYAMNAGGVYASETLGGAPRNLINRYWGNDWENNFFDWTRVGYTLYDNEGNALQEQEMPGGLRDIVFKEKVVVTGQYMKVISTTPYDEYYADVTDSVEAGIQVTVMPAQGKTSISAVHVHYTDGHYEEWPADGTVLGYLKYTGGNTVTFISNIGELPMGDDWYPDSIIMFDMGGNAVYEVMGSTSVFLGSSNVNGPIEWYLPAATVTTAAPVGVTYTDGDYTSYDAIPAQGITVASMKVNYGTEEDGEIGGEGVASPDLIGTVFHDYLGNAEFHSSNPMRMDIPENAIITYISFEDARQNLIYEARCPDGVGSLSYDENGYLVFKGMMPGTDVPEETVPQETIVLEETEVEATQMPAELEGQLGFAEAKIKIYSMPSTNGTVLGALEKGQEFRLLQQEHFSSGGESKPWGLIEEGWILLEDVLLAVEADSAVQTDSTQSGATVAEAELTVYSAPFQGIVLGTIEAGEEYELLQQKEVNGNLWGMTKTGWILMEEVETPTARAALPAAAAETVPDETAAEAAEPAMARSMEPVPQETTVSATEPKATSTPENTDSATGPAVATADEEAPVPTEPAPYPEKDVEIGVYYDSEQGMEMVAEYVMVPIPEGYTMDIQLASGALRSEFTWTLLRVADAFRAVLLEVLGICIAVFVLCVVHLCCSAGRTRRSNEVKAGGLNRIPLDLYLGGGAVLGMGLVVMAAEGSQYLARNDEQLAILFLAACAYLASLLIVGFFFAFVAQIKTPGGFWWRNSLCGWCLKLLGLCWHGLADLGRKSWAKGKPLAGRFFPWLGHTCTALWVFTKKTALWIWDTGKRIGIWSGVMIGKCFSWSASRLARFFGMLPITWQFLATGFILVFLLYAMMRTYKVGYILLGFGIFFAVILYAASAFAILLESAKRMSKGDLDTKVDDRMLIGGFKEFAAKLNDLAGVAVIAAQKQLKSERMKTELITNVSHDIKTPLTSIINYVDLLQKPHSPEQQEQYLDVLDRQSQRLKKLIDDLMEMSKASTGNLAVDIEKVDAAEAVNQALGEFADKLERAQLTPVFRQPEEQVYMMADGRLVWRVMSNLLGNAVKYALPGTRIYLDLLEMDGKVIISMKNISREELNVNADELMERFVRGDASRNTEGSGLGLNIAQSLMELQKGQLQILVDGDLFKVTLIFPGV